MKNLKLMTRGLEQGASFDLKYMKVSRTLNSNLEIDLFFKF
jgi:hypothetical protein